MLIMSCLKLWIYNVIFYDWFYSCSICAFHSRICNCTDKRNNYILLFEDVIFSVSATLQHKFYRIFLVRDALKGIMSTAWSVKCVLLHQFCTFSVVKHQSPSGSEYLIINLCIPLFTCTLCIAIYILHSEGWFCISLNTCLLKVFEKINECTNKWTLWEVFVWYILYSQRMYHKLHVQ